MRHIQSRRPSTIDVRMVETRLLACWNWYKTYLFQCHHSLACQALTCFTDLIQLLYKKIQLSIAVLWPNPTKSAGCFLSIKFHPRPITSGYTAGAGCRGPAL